jgi:SAM-dependent methyltransferase
VKRFLQTLQDSGYRQFYLAFGDANFRQQDWPTGAEGLSGPLLCLVKLFLLQHPVPEKLGMTIMGGEFVEELIDCGILRQKSGKLASNSFFLIFCRSQAFFCQMTEDPLAYFGDDSVALATLQTPTPGGNVLDLCCGPGIQSFVAAAHAAEVTGVELRRETWRIAELNARLNGLEGRVRFVCDSAEGFAKAGTQKYDRILFNPPLVPMVPGYKFALVGNGGGDGMELTRQILKLYPKRLSDSGTIEFIGMGLGRKERPVFADEIKAIARRHGFGMRMQFISRHPIRTGAPLFEVCVSSLARRNGLDGDEARKILGDHFQKLGMDSYWLFFASVGPGRKTQVKTESSVDLTRSFLGHWFV